MGLDLALNGRIEQDCLCGAEFGEMEQLLPYQPALGPPLRRAETKPRIKDLFSERAFQWNPPPAGAGGSL